MVAASSPLPDNATLAANLREFADVLTQQQADGFRISGRYTHRVAIANGRLLDCQNGRVSFRWKDYRAQNKSKAMTLYANEFMRRFLMHVLPKGFRRIRHFGFLANACCVEKLARIRAALDVPNPEPRVKPKDYRERCALLTGQRPDICSCCGGRMVDANSWQHPSPPRPKPRCDSS